MFNVSQFTYLKSAKSLSAEASELPDLSGKLISIKGKTRTIWFEFSEVQRDNEGEITAWIYRPTTPVTTVERVIIFND